MHLGNRTWPRGRLIGAFALAGLVAALAVGFRGVREAAAGGPSGCSGTYLVVVDGAGVQDLWSFAEDGIFLSTSSSDAYTSGTDGQGAWVRMGRDQAKVTGLGFTRTANSPIPVSIVRADTLVTFSTDCESLTASGEFRAYGPADDALDPTDGEFLFPATFTGRRVSPR